MVSRAGLRPCSKDWISRQVAGFHATMGPRQSCRQRSKQPAPVEFELASEAPADDVANATVRQAAIELGVSERRVRKLARDGRVRGATKARAE